MNYINATTEEIAKHFQTVSRQRMSQILKRYEIRNIPNVVSKLKKAKQMVAAHKRAAWKFNVPDIWTDADTTDKTYKIWKSMISRCYNKDDKRYMDKGVAVSEYFRTFHNFKLWAYAQAGFGKGFELNKDLLSANTSEYSENTCVFIPREISTALVRKDKTENQWPIGVRCIGGKYYARRSKVHIGVYDTVQEAAAAYKKSKEAHIKFLATKYQKTIDKRAYEALLNYSVS